MGRKNKKKTQQASMWSEMAERVAVALSVKALWEVIVELLLGHL
ncbi:hypothetical protein [Streptomyces sp. NRRL S-31]|nr:hypothetical protein [Streptomyces sp. NRRL S-31]